jgi:hypothetical protein
MYLIECFKKSFVFGFSSIVITIMLLSNMKSTFEWKIYHTLSSNERLKETMINLLNAKLNPICHLLALLGAHHIFHVGRIRVKRLCLVRMTSIICLNVYVTGTRHKKCLNFLGYFRLKSQNFWSCSLQHWCVATLPDTVPYSRHLIHIAYSMAATQMQFALFNQSASCFRTRRQTQPMSK